MKMMKLSITLLFAMATAASAQTAPGGGAPGGAPTGHEPDDAGHEPDDAGNEPDGPVDAGADAEPAAGSATHSERAGDSDAIAREREHVRQRRGQRLPLTIADTLRA
jgi:hypothetical protein